jgi:translocation and assembly module TamA
VTVAGHPQQQVGRYNKLMPHRFVPHGFLLSGFLLGTCLLSRAVNAADPQPYAVTLQPTDIKPLNTALHDASTLIALEKKAPVGPFALVQRALQDADRFQTVLHSYGYYDAAVTLTIDGHALTDPALPDLLARHPADPPAKVEAAFTPGPLFHIGRITINGAVPQALRDKLGLEPGAPAVAADVVAAQDRLLTALRDESYPLARVELEPANLRPPEHLLDVAFDAQTGPRADLGPIDITGLQQMNESFLRRRLPIHQGDPFSPTALDEARQNLMALGVFSSVRMDPADHLNANGNLPITIAVTENKLHAVDLGASYSTDLGLGASVGWHHRNLFGNAEQLNLLAESNVAGNATHGPGYKATAQFIKPDFLALNQQLEIDFGALKQNLEAYDQTAITQEIKLHRQFGEHWDLSVGLLGEQERILQEDVSRHYNLIGVPLVAKYDSTDSLLDPTRGIRARIGLTPFHSMSNEHATFFTMEVSGSTYFDLSGGGRSVLAMRGLVGKIAGANVFSLPPDQRFYAGGSATVRGYRYQSIGPKFPSLRPTGGTAVSAGSLEFRQRILDKYGAVAFVDTGQVSDNGVPFTSHWRIGAGVGFRYYTPIGPVRLDVAVPLNKELGGDSFELYIGIGQAF